MPWTDRQRAMLQLMGLRLWPAPAAVFHPQPNDAGAAPPGPPAAFEPLAAPLRRVIAGAPAPAREPATAPETAASADGPTLRLDAESTGHAGRPDVTGLGWAALREAVAGCRACGLCAGRTQTVFGVGSEQAEWMVVGEAPGEQEDREGEPFVGPAGQLLDRMLAALRLTRANDPARPPAQRVYIANTLKCRPPRNRNPGADELAQCEPYLVRQIELLRPRLILAMGRFAVQSLLATDEPIGRLRGRVHRYQGVPVVVTYHPAYLLRSLPDKARAWDDLCLAAQVAEDAGAPVRSTV